MPQFQEISTSTFDQIQQELLLDEGCRDLPYDDSTGLPPKIPGKLTIGVGRNLTDVPLSDDAISFLLAEDIDAAYRVAKKLVPDLLNLSQNRQCAIINLSFNLGYTGLSKFKNTLKAINAKQWSLAADGLRSSLWAKQVQKRRSQRIIKQIEEG